MSRLHPVAGSTESIVHQKALIQNALIQYALIQYASIQYASIQYASIQYALIQYATIQREDNCNKSTRKSPRRKLIVRSATI